MKSSRYNWLVLLIINVFISGNLYAKGDTFSSIYYRQGDISVDYACIDLQRYIGQVTGDIPNKQELSSWQRKKQAGIVVIDLKQASEYVPSIKSDDLGDEGFAIKKVNLKGENSILLIANTSLGKVNAIYRLLKELNFEFALGSESIPASLPSIEEFTDELLVLKPVFAVRGVLPWYNFFNSPTSWDPVDHRTFVDQLIRSGANFITFHSYEHEPFVAVEENNDMIFGEPLHDTGIPTWGTNPMKTSEFLFSTDKFFGSDYFGAKTTQSGFDRATQIKKEKEILRDALLYAKERGLKTSIGFAPLGDPTKKEDRDRFIKEFTTNLEYYKSLDYIFIWQTETKGAQGHPLQYDQHILPDTRDPNSKIINYGEYRRDIFKRIVEKESGIKPFFKNTDEGKIARATEGARLEMYVKIALRILSRYKNAPKIVVSGWGGENYLLSEEYYDGLDKVLPKDVAFSSLESLTPKTYIDKAYFELPADRQRWPIPWLENDGDQWHPQPFLKTYEPMVNDLLKSGSQGFLTIHWRTRDVEDNLGFLLDYSWNPGLTKEEFFAKKARKYGKAAEDIKQIYIDLDDLGYRWLNGHGQNECAIFTWGSGSVEKLEKLKRIKKRLNDILPTVGFERSLVWLNDRMKWVIDYQYAEMQAETAKALLEEADKADDDKKKELAKQAFGILSGGTLADAMQSYTQRITTRGEYGVLATINAKAAYDWRTMYEKASSILDLDAQINNEWKASSKVIIPRLYGSAAAQEDLGIEVIAPNGKDVILSYRQLGSNKWKNIEMNTVRGWVKSAVIPSKDVVGPAIEYQIVSDGFKNDKYVITINDRPTEPQTIALKNIAKQTISDIQITKEKSMQILQWNDLTDADYYQVYINGKLEVESPVPFYPYEKSDAIRTVTVKAMKNMDLISEMEKKF